MSGLFSFGSLFFFLLILVDAVGCASIILSEILRGVDVTELKKIA